MSINELRSENDRLKAKMKYIYDANSMEYANILLIAGKTEGFDYKDADIFAVENDPFVIERKITELKSKGYVVVLVTAMIDRRDFV